MAGPKLLADPRLWRCAGLLLALLLPSAFAADADPPTAAPLRFLASEAWAMPFGQIRREAGRPELVDGIMKDWQEALAAALGRQPLIVLSSRKRAEQIVREQGADLRCLMNPDWIPAADRDRYDWPEPFLRIEQRLLSSRELPPVNSVAQLQGRVIGTVGGYFYPLLDEAFASGRLRREDAPTEQAAFDKQLKGRVDYTVVRELDYQYQRKRSAAAAKLLLSPLPVASNPVYCARIRSGTLTLEALNQAQRGLLQRGVLRAILRRHLE
jgi:ABC-type amino acid transport substrate-binding protein